MVAIRAVLAQLLKANKMPRVIPSRSPPASPYSPPVTRSSARLAFVSADTLRRIIRSSAPQARLTEPPHLACLLVSPGQLACMRASHVRVREEVVQALGSIEPSSPEPSSPPEQPPAPRVDRYRVDLCPIHHVDRHHNVHRNVARQLFPLVRRDVNGELESGLVYDSGLVDGSGLVDDSGLVEEDDTDSEHMTLAVRLDADDLLPALQEVPIELTSEDESDSDLSITFETGEGESEIGGER